MGKPRAEAKGESTSSTPISKRYTVAFEVDGERYKTLSVKEGETITETVADPKKEGYDFDGWYEGDNPVVLAEYVVTKNVTFSARFKEKTGDVLNVDDVKDATKSYHLVLGWWEVNDEADPTKVTSGLTKDTVRLFYGNLINYLKKTGSTDENIAAISFRNYSTATVAEMGEKINADGDVDLMIGVGANIFTTAGVEPYVDTTTSKFSTKMGEADKDRYVALIKDARDLAVDVYAWLQTDAGKASFVRELTDKEIEDSLAPVTINLTVNVHGDTLATTLLDDETKTVTMPAITVPEGKVFKGFATSEGGEVVLNVAIDATLKYDDLKGLVTDGATTLDLYPVFEDAPVVTDDLVVYVQTGSNLPEAEAKLLEDRFNSTLTEEKVSFTFVEKDAAGFTADVEADPTVDVVIGGNTPLKNYSMHKDGALANAGGKHFANTSRKVGILNSVSKDHLELAKTFYAFVTNDAVAYSLHSTFWTKAYDWVTEAEVASIKTGIETSVRNYLGLEEMDTLDGKYNVTLDYYEATNTKVGDLGAETNALREGKGTDLLIGCGANVTTMGKVEVVEKKDIDVSIVKASRMVALVHETSLAREVYDHYFTVSVAE
ncbi:MAG: InlB B-repeat-containing protein [Candidatus Enteromonas sp.]